MPAKPQFFDIDGTPITALEWSKKFEDLDSRIIAQDTVESHNKIMMPMVVRTLWMGFKPDGCRCCDIFMTLGIVGEAPPSRVGSWPTKEVALLGHQKMVSNFRAYPH